MTPCQFHYLRKRWEAGRDEAFLGFGIVAATIANCNRDPKKKPQPFKPEDFVPGIQKKKAKALPMRKYWEMMVMPHAEAASRQAKRGVR